MADTDNRAPIDRSPQSPRTPRLISRHPNGRLHLALLLALAIASPLLGLPLASAHTGPQKPSAGVAYTLVADGLAATFRAQAQAVATAVAGVHGSSGSASAGIPGSRLIPTPLLVAASQVITQGAAASPQSQITLSLQRVPVRFTVHEEGFTSPFSSSRRTVGQALATLGVELGPSDRVFPSPGTPLTTGLHVFVDHALQVALSVGGQQQTVYTHAATVADLLAEHGIALDGQDRVSPDLSTPVRRGLSVEVTIIREDIEFVDELIEHDTVYQDDPDLPRGESYLIQAGSDGYVRQEYRVIQQNGVETSRELLSETAIPPTDEIIARGTRPPVYVLSTPSGDLECSQKLSVYATWYTAASAGGSGRTATGVPVTKGVVAVDPRVIALATKMYIPGYGYGVAADTGGAIISNIIDLGYGPDDVHDWSSRWLEICIFA